ncbi:Uncharacterised protein [Burkholderia pseudomallei]|nr:hypothetical protein PTBPS01_19715 [Burkholderia pseudomallei]ONA45014.1 hypothetical protein AQ878_00915 [Burkholderia pseudomallei]CAJ6889161.1 Uncharacterised protein [Burkholderia pseudomallei]CAJ8170788.1 Uncharacterised protein [Burkholderia pseudomallei]VCQ90580.1 Uncharacterised protein [Burkholderia pseudomallei]
MQGKFCIFVRDLPQAVPHTLVVLSARMKKIDCFKGGTNKTLVFFAEMVSDCAYACAEVILKFLLVTRELKQPPPAKYCSEVPALVHN